MADDHDFTELKRAVAGRFAALGQRQLYRAAVAGDALWAAYLGAFPPGTDPLFRQRTVHDCSCCRRFVRAVGNVVALNDAGEAQSIWGVDVKQPRYAAVAGALDALVRAAPVADLFLHAEGVAGVDRSYEDVVDGVTTWDHLFVRIPSGQRNERNFVCDKKELGPKLAAARADHDVLLRGLGELTLDAVDTVLDLVAQKSLYRGDEQKFAVEAFRALKLEFDELPPDRCDAFAWARSVTAPGSVTRIRNTAVGALLVDLSGTPAHLDDEGRTVPAAPPLDLEAAVRRWEKTVAPANYKRPTALVTPAMVAKAKATVEMLGLTSALERRYATAADLAAPDLLFLDRSVRGVVAAVGVFDGLAAPAPLAARAFDRVEEVPVARFLADVLPRAAALEALVENRHAGRLVSLVAPADPTAAPLFKWDNGFSWTYVGDVADSDLRQAVQARGGRVDGAFRFSHSWNHERRNASLMDLHVFMPGSNARPENGSHDLYGNYERVGWNHRRHQHSGGVQDVDYVIEAPIGYVPVENITFPDLRLMPQGRYVCKIHNWQLRSPTQGGFRAEIEFDGQLFQYDYEKPLGNKEWVTVAEVTLSSGKFEIKHHLPERSTPRVAWGLQTQQFHRVTAAMLSPNHWVGRGVGNRHYFFMLDGCRNDGTARGFYNEHLRGDLDPHRRVLELVGGRVRAPETGEQLSGLGFSDTRRDHLVVRVTGATTRVVKVMF